MYKAQTSDSSCLFCEYCGNQISPKLINSAFSVTRVARQPCKFIATEERVLPKKWLTSGLPQENVSWSCRYCLRAPIWPWSFSMNLSQTFFRVFYNTQWTNSHMAVRLSDWLVQNHGPKTCLLCVISITSSKRLSVLNFASYTKCFGVYQIRGKPNKPQLPRAFTFESQKRSQLPVSSVTFAINSTYQGHSACLGKHVLR